MTIPANHPHPSNDLPSNSRYSNSRYSNSRPSNPRRGSTYLVVLFTSLIVTVVAFAGFQRLRIQEQDATLQRDWNEAAVLASSAVEYALTKLGNDHDWRNAYYDRVDGHYSEPMAFGRGTIRWQLEDPVDGDLRDSQDDPVRIYGYGTVGSSQRVFSMLAWPSGSPLDALRSAVHAGGNLRVQAAADVRSGPATANGQVQLATGTLLGDVEATSVDTADAVVGTVTLLPVPKSQPSTVVFSVYRSLATPIPSTDLGSGSNLYLQDVLVSPDQDPTAGTTANADGIYRIQLADYQSLTIRDCRIEGTLLVELGAYARLTIGPRVVWGPARPDYPALLVDGTADHSGEVLIECSGDLVEADTGVNFNPSATPYYGDSDSDLSDRYTASLNGLFHIIRATDGSNLSDTVIRAPRKIRGCILADGEVRIDEDSILAADPLLYAKPPQGYATFPDPANLLTNGDMENGAAGWSKLGANTSLSNSSDAHDGAASLHVAARDTPSSGIQQDVTTRLLSGFAVTSEVWLKMLDSQETLEVVLEVDSAVEGVQRWTQSASVGTEWTRVQLEHEPLWSGSLNYARWQIRSTESTQEFCVDDAILHQAGEGPATTLSAVPGSWRAESVHP